MSLVNSPNALKESSGLSSLNCAISFNSGERELYILRRNIEKDFNLEKSLNNCTTYIASLSSKTIVYKGMLLSTQVRGFYHDLLDKDVLVEDHSKGE